LELGIEDPAAIVLELDPHGLRVHEGGIPRLRGPGGAQRFSELEEQS
jgi:hypothetical protein